MNAPSLSVSDLGQRLASVAGTIQIWDLATGQNLWNLTGRAPIAFSPDGAHLVSDGEDGDEAMRIWDLATGQNVQTLDLRQNYLGALAGAGQPADLRAATSFFFFS